MAGTLVSPTLCPSPSASGVTEARPPAIVCGPGMPLPIPIPPQAGTSWAPYKPPGPAEGVLGSEKWSPRLEDGGTGRGSPWNLALTAFGTPTPHPAEVCCQCILKRGQK